MKALIVALLVFSQTPPVGTPPVLGTDQLDAPVVELREGEVVPWDATCLTKTQAMKKSTECLACKETLKFAQENNFLLPKSLTIALFIGLPILGAAIGGLLAAFAVK